MRKAIQDYRREKKQPPHALDDLVRAQYLREIPIDSVTGSADWRTVTEESVRIDDFTTGGAPRPSAPGIVDVHSNAPGTDANGKPWSEY